MTKHKKPFEAEDISNVEISYFTPDLPPPYCYNYFLSATVEKQGLKVEFKLQYIDREDIEEEEILAEGFTMSDDFSFNGDLPAVWKRELITQLERTKFLKGTPRDHPIHLIFKNSGLNETHEGYPSDLNSWEYFLQELVQAVFEAGKKERPLEIRYKAIDTQKKAEEIVLNVSFLSRTASKSFEVNGKKETTTIAFKELKKIFKAVYMPDYLPEKADQRQPVKPGRYLNPGDGLWYEFGKALLNPDPEFDSLKKAERLLKGEDGGSQNNQV